MPGAGHCPVPPGCTLTPNAQGIIAADFDQDRDVDATDFAAFQRALKLLNP